MDDNIETEEQNSDKVKEKDKAEGGIKNIVIIVVVVVLILLLLISFAMFYKKKYSKVSQGDPPN